MRGEAKGVVGKVGAGQFDVECRIKIMKKNNISFRYSKHPFHAFKLSKAEQS